MGRPEPAELAEFGSDKSPAGETMVIPIKNTILPGNGFVLLLYHPTTSKEFNSED